MEKRFRKRKNLGILLYSYAFLENNLHIPQKSIGKANGNFFSPQFHSTYGQIINEACQVIC